MNLLWAFLLCLCAVAAMAVRGMRLMVAGPVSVLALAFLVPGSVLVHQHVWIDTIAPALAVVGASVLALFLEADTAVYLAKRFTPSHVRDQRPTTLTEEVTVMFVDLKGSTPLAARIGADAYRELMREVLATLSRVVARHGGEVERTLGDGMLVVFRARGKSHHALRCVQAVQPLRDSLVPIDARLASEHGLRAAITIGIEAGMVSGAVVEAADREEWSSFGPTVNLAARIQSACGANGVDVLLGPTAHALVQHQVPTRWVGLLDLKGIEEPVAAYTLVGTADLPAAETPS